MSKDLIGTLAPEDRTQEQGSKLTKAWKEYQHTGKYALLRALFSLHKWTVITFIVFSWFGVVLETLNIFVLKEVMSYIDGENDNMNRALSFVLGMVLLEFVSRSIHMARDRFELAR